MELRSEAFKAGEKLPMRYTCAGENVSPPLRWSDLPRGTRALVLIADEIKDDKPLSHWVVYNIPPEINYIDEISLSEERFPWGGLQGRNDFGSLKYEGPCDKAGTVNTLCFTLYALDMPLLLDSAATRTEVIEWMQGHILEQSELTGVYKR